mmetsp:Transcript_65245/g.172948  ORF Transcript_65245/g.172948 Transcript_65245/m.172948 type:complete len:206 (-) Transcript_65245:317-934(-)
MVLQVTREEVRGVLSESRIIRVVQPPEGPLALPMHRKGVSRITVRSAVVPLQDLHRNLATNSSGVRRPIDDPKTTLSESRAISPTPRASRRIISVGELRRIDAVRRWWMKRTTVLRSLLSVSSRRHFAPPMLRVGRHASLRFLNVEQNHYVRAQVIIGHHNTVPASQRHHELCPIAELLRRLRAQHPRLAHGGTSARLHDARTIP